MLKTICPNCNTPLKAPDAFDGKAPRCPRCRKRVRARSRTRRRNAAAAAASAAGTQKPKGSEDALLDDLLAEVKGKADPATAPGKPAARAAAGDVPGRARAAAGAAPVLMRKPKKSMAPVVIMVAVSAAVILGAGAYMLNMIKAKRESGKAQRLLQDVGVRVSGIAGATDRGDALLKRKKYAEAQKVYQGAGRDAEQLSAELQSAVAAVSSAEARKSLQDEEAKVRRQLDGIRTKLADEELKNGVRGLVSFDGKWVTPEEKEKLYKKKMEDAGKAWRADLKKWMTEAEYNKAKGYVLYRNKWMTKKQMARVTEVEKARQAKGDARRRQAEIMARRKVEVAQLRRKAREKLLQAQEAARAKMYPPDGPRWVLDNFEEGKLIWKAQTWGNPATTSVVSHKGSKRLQVDVERGLEDKAAIGRPMKMDLTSRDQIAMDVVNVSKGVIKVALAVNSDTWYESRMKLMPVGESRLMFSLRAGDFKSTATKWAHTTKVKNLDAVKQVYVLFYTKRNGVYYVDNVVAERLR